MIYIIKRFIKRLFCKHDYNSVSLDLSGTWLIYECPKCDKLRKGGAPNCKIAVKLATPRVCHFHEHELMDTVQTFKCKGCDEKIKYHSGGQLLSSYRIYEDEE